MWKALVPRFYHKKLCLVSKLYSLKLAQTLKSAIFSNRQGLAAVQVALQELGPKSCENFRVEPNHVEDVAGHRVYRGSLVKKLGF